jgi:hypothetical protein
MIKLKKDNTQLLKGIIESDFLFLNKRIKNKLRVLRSTSNINNINISYIDSLETLKTVKQFVRILQFLNTKENKILHIVMKNKQFVKIAESFFSARNSDVIIKDSTNLQNLKTENQLLLLFDHINNNSLVLKKLFDKNIYLINKVNTKIEQNNWGTYKIFNDLDDFKKFIFFVVLIELSLNKNYASK